MNWKHKRCGNRTALQVSYDKAICIEEVSVKSFGLNTCWIVHCFPKQVPARKLSSFDQKRECHSKSYCTRKNGVSTELRQNQEVFIFGKTRHGCSFPIRCVVPFLCGLFPTIFRQLVWRMKASDQGQQTEETWKEKNMQCKAQSRTS